MTQAKMKSKSSVASNGKPKTTPKEPHASGDPLAPVIQGRWIWCPLKGEWRVMIPEEKVRQQYVLRLWHQYGYSFDQLDQERRTKHGRTSPKADIVIWTLPEDKRAGRAPLIVVECKSDNVKIDVNDFAQGDSYVRAVGEPCEFLVMHNNKETRFLRIVRGLPGTREDIEDIPKRSDLGSAKKMAEIRRATKAFTREEFRRLLFDCHCILRDNHKMDPGRAFDEISKILFIKMYIERTGNYAKFTTEYLDDYARIRRSAPDEVGQDLFSDTKKHYKSDGLFGEDERLNVSFATFKRIVEKLQRFHLGDTSDDIKGIAFERFLGQTFRGELGQYFTPRPVVDFMVEMLDPQEREVICDPASGSGGFLIKCFEYVRSKIEADIQQKKIKARKTVERDAKKGGWNEEEKAQRIDESFSELNKELDVTNPKSRLYHVAHDCIFGCDAEPRAARTSKMNMIMHGDGHGGIHHHDGFVDINGIFPDRFNLVVTNPPFGSVVREDQVVGATPESRVTIDAEEIEAYSKRFGKPYELSHARMTAAAENNEPILKMYDIGRDPIGGNPANAKVRASRFTQMLYMERCLDLLMPGGRLGIVLPESILNNPSEQWLRDYCEGRARIRAVISIPQEVFSSAKATVKTSLVFMMKFTENDSRQWEDAWIQARSELSPSFEDRRQKLRDEYEPRIECFDREDVRRKLTDIERLNSEEELNAKAISKAKKELSAMLTTNDRVRQKDLRREFTAAIKEVDDEESKALRKRVKELFDYPVFMAEVEQAGITSTGDTGKHVLNELPDIVVAYRKFLKDPLAFEAELLEQADEIEATGPIEEAIA